MHSGGIGGSMYIGKKVIEVEEEFFELPYVRQLYTALIGKAANKVKMEHEIHRELEQLVVPAAHSEHVTKMPKGARRLGSSEKSKNEIWTLDNRVLCLQFHPEYNTFFIEELIINKMYDVG